MSDGADDSIGDWGSGLELFVAGNDMTWCLRQRNDAFSIGPRWLSGGLMIAAAACSGCGSSVDVVPQTAAEKELTEISKAYNDAHGQLGHGPKDAEELKPFLKAFGDPDDLLVSPNDKQPYVVVWNANPSGGPTDYEGMFPILAYEKEGSGGRRAITDVRGVSLTVPAGDLSKVKFVGRHKPETN